MRFKTHFKRNQILFERIVGPGTVMSKAVHINTMRSSSVRMQQSSSSNLPRDCTSKLKSMKVLSNLSLDRPNFLIIAYNKHFAVSAYGMGKDGQKSSGPCLAYYLLSVAC